MDKDSWRSRLLDRARGAEFKPECHRFYYLRHGQTEHNRLRICQGHTDVSLNATGLAQADAAAPILAAVRPTAIRASDLMRVRQTAAPIAKFLGLNVETDPRLRERGFGIYEDKPSQGQLWSLDHPSVEPIEAFVDRSLEGFAWALQQDDVLVVTHGGLRRVLSGALDVELSDWTAHNALPMRFSMHDDGAWKVEVLTAAGTWPADGPEPADLGR